MDVLDALATAAALGRNPICRYWSRIVILRYQDRSESALRRRRQPHMIFPMILFVLVCAGLVVVGLRDGKKTGKHA